MRKVEETTPSICGNSLSFTLTSSTAHSLQEVAEVELSEANAETDDLVERLGGAEQAAVG